MGIRKRKFWIAVIATAFTVAFALGGCSKNAVPEQSGAVAPGETATVNQKDGQLKTLGEDITPGDTLVYENFAQVKLLDFSFDETVMPSSPAQFYTSYTVREAGNLYAHLTFEIYNACIEGMAVEDFFSLILEDNGNHKNYAGFAVVEVNNGSDLAPGKEHLIPPLTSAKVHLLTEVPKGVTNSGVPYKLQLKFMEATYRLNPDKAGGQTYGLGDFLEGAKRDGGLPANVVQHSLGESVQNGEETYIVKSLNFGNTVRPPNAAGNHSNFELIEEGQTYAHVVVAYKNGSAAKPATEATPVCLYYKDCYSYTGNCVIEEPGGKNFTYPNLVEVGAGETVMLHYMIAVPTQVQTNAAELRILLDFGEGSMAVYKAE